jgi:hypothetical protein
MHSSAPQASTVSLFGEVSMRPLLLRSTQSERRAAKAVTRPVPRLLTMTKRPSAETAVREGLSVPPAAPVR